MRAPPSGSSSSIRLLFLVDHARVPVVTADRLASELAPSLEGRRFVILDLARVRSIDVTAVHALKPIAARLSEAADGCSCARRLSARSASGSSTYVERLGLARGPSRVEVVPNVDDALDWAVERIVGEARRPSAPLALQDRAAPEAPAGRDRGAAGRRARAVRRPRSASLQRRAYGCRDEKDLELELVAAFLLRLTQRHHDDSRYGDPPT